MSAWVYLEPTERFVWRVSPTQCNQCLRHSRNEKNSADAVAFSDEILEAFAVELAEVSDDGEAGIVGGEFLQHLPCQLGFQVEEFWREVFSHHDQCLGSLVIAIHEELGGFVLVGENEGIGGDDGDGDAVVFL